MLPVKRIEPIPHKLGEIRGKPTRYWERRTGTVDGGRPAKNVEHWSQVRISIDSLDSHDANGERAWGRCGRSRANEAFTLLNPRNLGN